MPTTTPDLPFAELDEALALRNVLKGTASATGQRFFGALVESLSSAVNTHMAWITEYVEDDDSLNALALLTGDKLQTDYRYPLAGTPCEPVIREARLVHHADHVQEIYPADKDLQVLKARSYLGVPLLDNDGQVLGHLAVLDTRPMPEEPTALALFQIFAARAAAELQRIKAEQEQQQMSELLQQVNQALSESEERFKDLFEEAPIAYVHEDVDSRLIHANRAALNILGLKPEDVPGTYGKSLVPDTPDAQRRVQEALESVGAGTDTSGIVLELQRKDNGKPIWIQWWSRPAPDGQYTRTMFIDITDRVLLEKEKALLEAQNIYLQEEIRSNRFVDIIGAGKQMQQIFSDVEQVAPTTATVLILGETGTGKELIARAIHSESPRAEKPLIKVNCSALPSSLIESELFGHEKGAFTGATKKREGRFTLADGGTIFLDEIGDLPIELQAKLLRVLQEGEFEPLGSSATRNVDARVIAATNRDLVDAIQQGEFREDLYFRLAVFPIALPPLRDRIEDLTSLVKLFVQRFVEQLGHGSINVTDADIKRLASYAWPGNVRELENIIERAIITSQDGSLNLRRALPETATETTKNDDPIGDSRIRTVEELQGLERDNFYRALDKTGWKVSGKDGAAEILGLNPSTMTSRMKALGIRRPPG